MVVLTRVSTHYLSHIRNLVWYPRMEIGGTMDSGGHRGCLYNRSFLLSYVMTTYFITPFHTSFWSSLLPSFFSKNSNIFWLSYASATSNCDLHNEPQCSFKLHPSIEEHTLDRVQSRHSTFPSWAVIVKRGSLGLRVSHSLRVLS